MICTSRFVLLLLLLLAVAEVQPTMAQGRADSVATVYLSTASLKDERLDLNQVRFHPGDDPAWAMPGFDDAAWRVTTPYLPMPWVEDSLGFRSIGWMRLRIMADSSIVNKPLGLIISQQGASEIYLDGKLVFRFGEVGSATATHAHNPADEPVFLCLGTAGLHVLAVRYANYQARRNLDRYFQDQAGMEMHVDHADRAFTNYYYQQQEASSMAMLWFGLFFALALLHLILFLYNRRQPPYLLFALFTICVAAMPLTSHIMGNVGNPVWQNKAGRTVMLLALAACVFFSAFLHSTFPPRRGRVLRFIMPLTMALADVVAMYVDVEAAVLLMIGLIAGVCIEAIFVVVRSVVRRVPGARILGAGILVLTFFILSVFIAMLTHEQLNFNGRTTSGVLVLIFLLAAVLSLPLSISAYLAWGIARTNKNLAARLNEVDALSRKSLEQEAEKQRILEQQNEVLESEVAARTNDLRRQKQRSDDLLLNILPAEVAEELKEKGSSEARHYHEVSVLFTDFVNFTSVAERLSPQELVAELNACFTAFDAIMERHGLEKIKTIGDAYMAVCGLPVEDLRHAQHCVQAALEIRDYVEARLSAARSDPSAPSATFDVRIGIHSGPVVAGIIGVKKFAYDVWGDAVNMAARMEQSSEAGRVNISEATYQLVKDEFACEPRGRIAAKNKGEIEMYFVERAVQPVPTS